MSDYYMEPPAATPGLILDDSDPKDQPLRRRPKRAQVVRACDSCRQRRIKCDNQIPCSNCRSRAKRCSHVSLESATLPEAYREIERLKHKIQVLEERLEREEHTESIDEGVRLSLGHLVSSPPTHAARIADEGLWGGVYIRAGHSRNETWYGASSLFYFIKRISNFLGSALDQPCSSEEMVNPNSASPLFDKPSEMDLTGNNGHQDTQQSSVTLATSLAGEFLNPVQEDHFLGLFWQSYHTAVLPILNETDFRSYYRTLCSVDGNTRQSSALVDMVVAMSMQLGISMQPASRQKLMGERTDGTVAGRQYYLRSQKLLVYELENPTLSTLQCQLLCTIYLCSATFHNMSDSSCAAAVRTAYMLGLHMDAPDSMPPQEREMRKRLWWALYILDSKITVKYGRPAIFQPIRVLPGLPEHGPEAAVLAGSDFALLGNNLSWLSFHHEQSKLFLVARAAHTKFYDQEDSGVSQTDLVASCTKALEKWAEAVPAALTTKRVGDGRPFSTNPSDLDVEYFSPLWLQRQRLLLELMYHNLCVQFYRPFIQFGPDAATKLQEQTAVRCVRHAINLTSILHQVLFSTSIRTVGTPRQNL